MTSSRMLSLSLALTYSVFFGLAVTLSNLWQHGIGDATSNVLISPPRHSSRTLWQEDKNTLPTMRHILFALSGNHTDFLGEFEVALKSVLIHGPGDPLTIHIIADDSAVKALGDCLFHNHTRVNWTDWRTRSPIKIEVYNVQHKQQEWLEKIEKRMAVAANMTNKSPSFRHTIGAYYRLFAGEILPKDVDKVLYLDSDVVILASLDDIWQRQVAPDETTGKTSSSTKEDEVLFYWGESRCSAFVVFRPDQTERIWQLFSQAPKFKMRRVLSARPVVSDQFVLQVVHRQFPHLVGSLSPEWDVSAQDGPWWKYGKKDLLLTHRPKVGMMHFNGGLRQEDAYFRSHKYYLNDPLWGLARYYVNMPWTWAQFALESQVRRGQGSYPIVVTYN